MPITLGALPLVPGALGKGPSRPGASAPLTPLRSMSRTVPPVRDATPEGTNPGDPPLAPPAAKACVFNHCCKHSASDFPMDADTSSQLTTPVLESIACATETARLVWSPTVHLGVVAMPRRKYIIYFPPLCHQRALTSPPNPTHTHLSKRKKENRNRILLPTHTTGCPMTAKIISFSLLILLFALTGVLIGVSIGMKPESSWLSNDTIWGASSLSTTMTPVKAVRSAEATLEKLKDSVNVTSKRTRYFLQTSCRSFSASSSRTRLAALRRREEQVRSFLETARSLKSSLISGRAKLAQRVTSMISA